MNETDRVEFVCDTFGLPEPNLFWSSPTSANLNNDAVTNTDFMIRSNSSRNEPNGGFTVKGYLLFPSIKASNAGEYTCNTFNAPTSSLNSSDSHTFTVVVQSELIYFITNCVI